MDNSEKSSSELFSQRKKDHIDISLLDESQAKRDSFSQLCFQHNALPEINFSDVTTVSEVFGHPLKSPLFVSSMTLGHEGAEQLNQNIAKACESQGWMMGVGSQRRQLFDPMGAAECVRLRESFPDLVLFGNLGLSQIIETPTEKVQELVDSLQAQFFVVHCNPLQEVIQPEGTPQFRGGLKALKRLCEELSVPVVLKETGCGFSTGNFEDLKSVGLKAIDVSGLGGTHWGRVEGLRLSKEDRQYRVAQTFANWGISTVDSVDNGIQSGIDSEIWASGGVRNGQQAAILMALGAQKVGFAKPILEGALQGVTSLIDKMQQLDEELKVTMFCLGLENPEQLIGKRTLLRWI